MSIHKFRRHFAWIGAAAAVVAGAVGVHALSPIGIAANASNVTTQVAYPSWIPADLLNNFGSGTVRKGYQRGNPEIRSAHRTVDFRWYAGSEANIDPSLATVPATVFDSGGVTQETQSFTTRYSPLTSAVLDASRVLVAGVDADGLSVIELWNLGWPAVMPAPAIGVGGSGPQSVNVVLPQRSVVRIYHAAASGLDFVANMTALRRSAGDPVQALVQFRPSLDIHVLDIPAGTLTLLASGTSGGGQLGQVPELQQHYFNHFYSKQHVSSGFVYFLVEQRRHANAVQRPPALLFFDTDMNGTLDSHATVQAVDFYGPGLWSDSAQYVEWWK